MLCCTVYIPYSANLIYMNCCVILYVISHVVKIKIHISAPPLPTFSPDCHRKHKNVLDLVVRSSVVGCFLTAELSGKIDALLRRTHRYGLSANILTFIFVYWKQKWQNASAQVRAIQEEYKTVKTVNNSPWTTCGKWNSYSATDQKWCLIVCRDVEQDLRSFVIMLPPRSLHGSLVNRCPFKIVQLSGDFPLCLYIHFCFMQLKKYLLTYLVVACT